MDARQFFFDVLVKNDFLRSEYIRYRIYSPYGHYDTNIPLFFNLPDSCGNLPRLDAGSIAEQQDLFEILEEYPLWDITAAELILQYYKSCENFFRELDAYQIYELLSDIPQSERESYEDLEDYQFEDGKIREIHWNGQGITIRIEQILSYADNGVNGANINFHLYNIHDAYVSPHLMKDSMVWYFHICREGELHKLVIATHTGYLQISAESYETEILKIL